MKTIRNAGFRQVITIVLITIAIIAGGLLIGQAYRLLLPRSASVESEYFDQLFTFTISIAGMIFLLVEGLLLYSVLRFRRRPGDEEDGPPVHGNTKLEIVWTVIPAIIVTVLSFYSYDVLKVVDLQYEDIRSWFCGPYLTPGQVLLEPVKGERLVVDVIGRQYSWEFVYPNYGGVSSAELHVPVGQIVLLRITSEDVIHSFWVPQFRLKKDAIPGVFTEARFTATQPGTYPVICAELCGLGHAAMRASLVAETPEEFETWISSLVSGEAGDGSPVEVGRRLFARLGCGVCHTLQDAGSAADLGPPLDDLAGRAGGRVPGLSAQEYVRQSIVEPQAYILNGYLDVMPAYGDRLTTEELSALVEYLLHE